MATDLTQQRFQLFLGANDNTLRLDTQTGTCWELVFVKNGYSWWVQVADSEEEGIQHTEALRKQQAAREVAHAR